MIHLIYIYLIINSFILGVYLADNFNADNVYTRCIYCFLLIFFGGIIALLDFISPKIFDGFEYILREIKFQYRMFFTDYFDKIYLDDKYTDLFDSREKKLKRTEELAQNSSKQMQRHNRQIQKKYVDKNN
jgi:hypothetical protein